MVDIYNVFLLLERVLIFIVRLNPLRGQIVKYKIEM